MRTAVLRVIISACIAQSISAQEAQTFETLLGRERIVRIVQTEQINFVRELTIVTNVRADVATSFDKDVADRVASIQLISPGTQATAEAMLRVRFRLFLANLTTYLLATTRTVKFDDASLKRYLGAAAKARRCGEVPCEWGCAEHKPCDVKCNPCSAERE